MGVVTNVFLYSLPYILAAVIGFLSASFLSGESTLAVKGINGRKVRQKLGSEAAHRREGTRVDGEAEASNQAKIEVCDRSTEDSDIGDENDDGAFNFSEGEHVPFKMARRISLEEMILRSRQFYQEMNERRSVRFFSDEPVPLEVIENIIKTAGTAPSGAHTEPWMYSVIRDDLMKDEIRRIIEEEERINYEKRMGPKWINDLKHIGTTYRKPYLRKCSSIIIVFKQVFSYDENGQRRTHYYHELSTAISVGLLLAAIQVCCDRLYNLPLREEGRLANFTGAVDGRSYPENAGLVTCTTTPMNAGPRLRTLLGRRSYEKVILLLPVGHPADDATVPDLHRKPLQEIMDLHD